MVEKTKTVSPPYATYSAFINFINKLNEAGIPDRIDPSVFGNASGSVSYSIIAALKYLKLIDDYGVPSESFTKLVKSEGAEREEILRAIITEGYPSLFSGDFRLSKATAGQFDEHIRKEFDVQGSTVDKIAAFFIAAAKQAGIQLSQHLLARKPTSSSSSSKKSSRQRKTDDNKPQSNKSSEQNGNTIEISEKALEYRLVDLMSAAMGEPDVMNAIIKVITFLKTREGADKDAATDD